MTARDDAIEAAWKAIPDDPEVEHMDIAAAVVDAVDQIIRADERERLRAQVEALIDGHCFDSTTWDTGVPRCRHRDHRSGWSASCSQAWAARHLLPLLEGESDD